jgi:hypothetical protein
MATAKNNTDTSANTRQAPTLRSEMPRPNALVGDTSTFTFNEIPPRKISNFVENEHQISGALHFKNPSTHHHSLNNERKQSVLEALVRLETSQCNHMKDYHVTRRHCLNH